MSISTVPGQTSPVELPGSQDQWKLFLEAAAARVLPWQEDEAGKLGEYFKENILECPAHCECTLTQYLTTRHGDSWDNVAVFSYIGVSGLSCSACSIWLEAFDQVGQGTFYTQGYYGKWNWPWGMPRVKGPFKEVRARESENVLSRKSLREIIIGKNSRPSST